MDFWQIIMTPFSWLLKVFCQWFNSYGIALILFTVVIKVILFPLNLKGKKSMIKMNIVSGQLKEIQQRCGNDKERYNQEVQKFYEKNNVSPFGGCGWSLIPLIILMPLYAIIRRPLKYMMRLADAGSTAVAGALGVADFTVSGYNELTLAAQLNSGNLSAAKDAVTAAGLSAAGMFVINFNFLGLNLAEIPSWKFWSGGISWNSVGLFLMPIISAVLSFLSMVVSQKTNQMNKDDKAASGGTNKMMMLVSPLISLWIGFSMPAGLCLYWIANSLLMMVQEVICGKMLKKDYEAARKEMEEQARRAKEEEKERRRKSAERKAAAIAAGKNKNGKGKKAQPQAKEKGVDLSASRSGMRSYARGRAYDPNRYPITPYQDPDEKYKKKDPDLEPLTEEEKELLAEAGKEIPEAPAEDAPAAEPAETGTAEPAEAEENAEDAAPAEGDYEEPYDPESEDDGDDDKAE